MDSELFGEMHEQEENGLHGKRRERELLGLSNVGGSDFSAFRSPKFNCNKMFDTKEELLMAIIKCLPYPDQITDLDFSTEKDAIRLTWRKSNRFRISTNGHVEEVGDGVLMGSDISIMFRELIKRQYVSELQ